MNCTTCGAPINGDVKFCEQCGTPVQREEATQPAVEATEPAAEAAQPAAAAAAIPAAAATPQPDQQQYANAGQQQQAYQQQAYQQQAYQQQTYQQYQQPYQAYQPYAPQYAVSDTQRALAMLIYLSGLLGLIVALLVRDRNDAFITHHLNNVVVITIGSFICGFLAIILIGFIGLIFLLVVWIMGIVHAYNGEVKELPLIGKMKIIK